MSESATESGKAIALSGLVPMIHVADVERSIEFYKKLGFEVGNRVPPTGRMQWAWLYCPAVENWKHGANLMVSRNEETIRIRPHEFVLYLYVADLVALRNELIASGMTAGNIEYPDYLPKGEFETRDPDSYCVMVAQAGPETP